jgi:putative Mg2+ transporter-C (MgtC) family protein
MILDEIWKIDWHRVSYHLWHLGMAFVLAIPIGLNREAGQRRFGMRTFPLVAVVTCGFMMVGMSVIETSDGEARVQQGIITGIGFIGGGAIFKDKDQLSGTASGGSPFHFLSQRLPHAAPGPEENLRNHRSSLSALRAFPRIP